MRDVTRKIISIVFGSIFVYCFKEEFYFLKISDKISLVTSHLSLDLSLNKDLSMVDQFK